MIMGEVHMTIPAIAVENLTFRHLGADEPCIAGTSFRVEKGEFVLLLGPSGCGKSTLGLTMNGIVPQSLEGEYTGSVQVFGEPAETTPVANLSKRVGMVFQDPESQFCMLEVNDELAFAPENLKLTEDEIRARVREAIERVRIQHLMGKSVVALSGGGETTAGPGQCSDTPTRGAVFRRCDGEPGSCRYGNGVRNAAGTALGWWTRPS